MPEKPHSALDSNGGDKRPVPDPSTLTTEQLHHEIISLEKLINAKLRGMQNTSMARLKLLSVQIKEQDSRINSAEKLVNQQNNANALASEKSETAFAKQIDQLAANVQTAVNGLNGKLETSIGSLSGQIVDAKERINAMEGHSKGAGDSMGWVIGVAGVLVAIIAVVAMVIVRTR